jgi:hypothetical protein
MAADVSGLRARALTRYNRAAERAAVNLEAELKLEAPTRSYKLRESIKVRAERRSLTTWRITAETGDLIQANTTNSGARPHIIRARRAKTLSFYWPKVGRRVNPVQVNHPGNRGTHWWDKTIERAPSIIRRALRGI